MHHKQLEFSVAFKAIAGARDYQEDSIKIWRPEGGGAANAERGSLLAVLSDGMGGHVSGEVASRLVCDKCVEYFQTVDGEPASKLEHALLASNDSLELAIRSDHRLSGMGCTLVLAYLDPDGLRWASVGDSQLLIFRNNRLYRLNDDHSLGALLDQQAEARVISFEEARGSPHRRSLRSAMTGGKIALADIERDPQQLIAGDWVIVASDGLESLTGSEIASIIRENGTRNHPLDIAEKLLEAVDSLKLPTQDNTSVIAIRVQEASDDKTQLMGKLDGPHHPHEVANSSITEPLAPRRGHVIGQVSEDVRRGSSQPNSAVKRSPAWKFFVAAALVFLAALSMFVVHLMNDETSKRLPRTDSTALPAPATVPAAAMSNRPSTKRGDAGPGTEKAPDDPTGKGNGQRR
jgi:PPM family protein phosphatase